MAVIPAKSILFYVNAQDLMKFTLSWDEKILWQLKQQWNVWNFFSKKSFRAELLIFNLLSSGKVPV